MRGQRKDRSIAVAESQKQDDAPSSKVAIGKILPSISLYNILAAFDLGAFGGRDHGQGGGAQSASSQAAIFFPWAADAC